MRKLLKKLWNKFLNMWIIARTRAKIKVQMFLSIFKRDNNIPSDIEKEFMKLFSDFEATIAQVFTDLDQDLGTETA